MGVDLVLIALFAFKLVVPAYGSDAKRNRTTILRATSEYLLSNHGIAPNLLDRHDFRVAFGEYIASGSQFNNITHGDLLSVPPFIRWDGKAVPIATVLLLDIDAPGPRGGKITSTIASERSETCARDSSLSICENTKQADIKQTKTGSDNPGKFGPWLHWFAYECENGDIDDWCCTHIRMYSDPFRYPPYTDPPRPDAGTSGNDITNVGRVPQQHRARGNHRFVALLFNHTRVDPRKDLRSTELYRKFDPRYYPDGRKPPGWANVIGRGGIIDGEKRDADSIASEPDTVNPLTGIDLFGGEKKHLEDEYTPEETAMWHASLRRFPIDIVSAEMNVRYPLQKFMDVNTEWLELISYTTWFASKDEKFGGVPRDKENTWNGEISSKENDDSSVDDDDFVGEHKGETREDVGWPKNPDEQNNENTIEEWVEDPSFDVEDPAIDVDNGSLFPNIGEAPNETKSTTLQKGKTQEEREITEDAQREEQENSRYKFTNANAEWDEDDEYERLQEEEKKRKAKKRKKQPWVKVGFTSEDFSIRKFIVDHTRWETEIKERVRDKRSAWKASKSAKENKKLKGKEMMQKGIRMQEKIIAKNNDEKGDGKGKGDGKDWKGKTSDTTRETSGNDVKSVFKMAFGERIKPRPDPTKYMRWWSMETMTDEEKQEEKRKDDEHRKRQEEEYEWWRYDEDKLTQYVNEEILAEYEARLQEAEFQEREGQATIGISDNVEKIRMPNKIDAGQWKLNSKFRQLTEKEIREGKDTRTENEKTKWKWVDGYGKVWSPKKSLRWETEKYEADKDSDQKAIDEWHIWEQSQWMEFNRKKDRKTKAFWKSKKGQGKMQERKRKMKAMKEMLLAQEHGSGKGQGMGGKGRDDYEDEL